MRHLFLLAILLLPALSASSQATVTKQICLPAAQGQKILDSLAVLPLVRAEAREWRTATDSLSRAADSLSRANVLLLDAQDASQRAFVGQLALTNNEAAKTAQWKQRARRRGFTSYLFLALLAGSGYLLFTH